jgi:hypothetical protein
MSLSPFQVALSPQDIAQAQQVFKVVYLFILYLIRPVVSHPALLGHYASRGPAEHQQARPSSYYRPAAQADLFVSRELLEVQRRPEAWGLVVPFLESPVSGSLLLWHRGIYLILLSRIQMYSFLEH